MPRVVHLGLEVSSYPTWIARGDDGLVTIDPAKLPLSRQLVEALMTWAKEHDDQVGPIISTTGRSPPDDAPATMRLHARGLELWRSAVAEIGNLWEVHYDSPLEGESCRVHRPPATET